MHDLDRLVVILDRGRVSGLIDCLHARPHLPEVWMECIQQTHVCVDLHDGRLVLFQQYLCCRLGEDVSTSAVRYTVSASLRDVPHICVLRSVGRE